MLHMGVADLWCLPALQNTRSNSGQVCNITIGYKIYYHNYIIINFMVVVV